VDKFVYLLAPFLALTLSLASLSVIPFGPKPLPFSFFGHQIDLWITNPDIGLLVLFAITALGVYGVALAGWASTASTRYSADCEAQRKWSVTNSR